MTTRCKFQCMSVMHRMHGVKITGIEVELYPIYGNSPENKAFWDATPNGSLKLTLSKPEHVGLFETGKEYYLDITSIEPAAEPTVAA